MSDIESFLFRFPPSPAHRGPMGCSSKGTALRLLSLALLLLQPPPLAFAQQTQKEGIEGLYLSPLLCPDGRGCVGPAVALAKDGAAGGRGDDGGSALSPPGPGAVLSVAWDASRKGYVLHEAGGEAGAGGDWVLLANATAAEGARCVSCAPGAARLGPRLRSQPR